MGRASGVGRARAVFLCGFASKSRVNRVCTRTQRGLLVLLPQGRIPEKIQVFKNVDATEYLIMSMLYSKKPFAANEC